MNKKIFALLLTCFVCTSSFGVTEAVIALHHQGNVTLFNSTQMQTAVDNAVSGDTIYLSSGTYTVETGFLTISKPITIIGAGDSSVLQSTVTIGMNEKPTARVLESIKIENGLNVNSDSCSICKCQMGSLSFGGTYGSFTAEQCNIDNLYLSETNADIVNCKILWVVNNIGRDVLSDIHFNFINCFVTGFSSGTTLIYQFPASFINCAYRDGMCPLTSNFYYCLLPRGANYDNTVSTNNCYRANSDTFPEESQFEDLGYLGDDGTVVGRFGGTTPFVEGFTPDMPTVSESTITVDKENRQLNVTLKVRAN